MGARTVGPEHSSDLGSSSRPPHVLTYRCKRTCGKGPRADCNDANMKKQGTADTGFAEHLCEAERPGLGTVWE